MDDGRWTIDYVLRIAYCVLRIAYCVSLIPDPYRLSSIVYRPSSIVYRPVNRPTKRAFSGNTRSPVGMHPLGASFVANSGGCRTMVMAILGLLSSPATAGNTRRRAPMTAPADVAAEWLHLGARAALEGNREDARYYFVQAVRSDMDNPRAWL